LYDFTNNRLLSINPDSPSVIRTNVPITGLNSLAQARRAPGRSNSPNVVGEFLIGIDFGPANGLLFAVASDGVNERVVGINIVTGVITPINAAAPTAPPDTFFGFDFNPVPDRIRVVGDAESNRRFNPNNGAITIDTPLAYAAGDPGAGSNPNVVHVAYTNNFAGATTTTLFGIDTNRNTLVRIGGVNGTPSPDGGLLTTIGPLGVDPEHFGGFDIQRGTGIAYASLFVNNIPTLYTINLATGAATSLGAIGDGTLEIDGLSVVINLGPTAAGVEVSGRVSTPDGRGLRNARVVITDSEGVTRTVTTNSFGFYTINDVEAGESYIIGVNSNRYRFASRVVEVSDSLSDVDFVGQE